MAKPRSLAIRAPLAALGAVLGIIAGGMILPTSCSFTEEQASRLHLTLPLAMPLALVIAATWLGRHLVSHLRQPRRVWVSIMLAMVLLAELLFTLAAAFAYKPDEPQTILAAWVFFWPILAALFPLASWVVIAARTAERTRVRSIAGEVARRQRWLAPLAAAGPVATAVYALHGSAVSWLADAAWLIAVAAVPAAAVLLFLDLRAARHVERVLAGAVVLPGRPTDDHLLIDLGLGDDLHASPDDSAHPYRPNGVAPTAIGDRSAVTRLLARACTADSLVLLLAVASAFTCHAVLAGLPPPQAPITVPGTRALTGGC